MNYCCQRFEFRHNANRTQGLNIRVIVYGDEVPSIKGKMAFFLTAGYNKGEKCMLRSVIDHCPYCGQKLDEFYDESYINEKDNSFIDF